MVNNPPPCRPIKYLQFQNSGQDYIFNNTNYNCISPNHSCVHLFGLWQWLSDKIKIIKVYSSIVLSKQLKDSTEPK